MTAPHGLVERCGVAVVALGIVAVGIFAGIQQQADGFDVTVLRGKGERESFSWPRAA